jgi:Arc/MetJ-type ribon-helix-helix transcriptional regulator
MAKQLSVRIDDDLEQMIADEIDANPYNPSESDIVRTALREFLEGNVNSSQAAKAD